MATHHHPLVDPSERSLIRPRLDRLIQSDKYRIDIGSEEGDHLKDVGAGVGRGRLWPCGHPVVLGEFEEGFQLGSDDRIDSAFRGRQGFGE